MPAREPSGPGRRKTPRAGVSELLNALSAADGQDQADLALTYVRDSTNMEVLRPALTVLQKWADPAMRPVLHERFVWCERSPERNDSGGFVRASIVRALRPVVHPDDLPLLHRALLTYQRVGLYDVTAELRGAALLALNDLDPDLAGLYAARFLSDPENGNSGEPALSSVRVLAAQQNLAPVFAFASWGGTGEVVAEALRSLVELPVSLVDLLVEMYRDSEDELVLLGLFDLLLGHAERGRWQPEVQRFLMRTSLLDLYGLVAMQIVASRNADLIEMLRELAASERDPLRRRLLAQALEHA